MCGCSWLLTVGLIEWVSEQLNPTQAVSRQAREANVGVNREMWGLQLGTIGCIMDGEAEESEQEAAVVVWAEMGLAGVWAGPSARPQGTLTQRAIDMEALCGLNCGLLAAGASKKKKKRQEEKENKGQERERSIHPSSLDLSLHPPPPNQLHSALHCTFLLTRPLLQALNGCFWIFDGAIHWIFNI